MGPTILVKETAEVQRSLAENIFGMVLKEYGNYDYGTYGNQLPKEQNKVCLSINSKVNPKTGRENCPHQRCQLLLKILVTLSSITCHFPLI